MTKSFQSAWCVSLPANLLGCSAGVPWSGGAALGSKIQGCHKSGVSGSAAAIIRERGWLRGIGLQWVCVWVGEGVGVMILLCMCVYRVIFT